MCKLKDTARAKQSCIFAAPEIQGFVPTARILFYPVLFGFFLNLVLFFCSFQKENVKKKGYEKRGPRKAFIKHSNKILVFLQY